MLSSEEFGRALLVRAKQKGISVTNMKLQKLAYYCQGYFYAATKERLFDERIEAWTHGPVVPALYSNYSRFGKQNIEMPLTVDLFTRLKESAQEMIDFVLDNFGKVDAWALRQMTHSESPWLNHYDKDRDTVDSQEITDDELEQHFSSKLSESQDKQLAKVLDRLEALESASSMVSMPEEINTSDEFIKWIRNR